MRQKYAVLRGHAPGTICRDDLVENGAGGTERKEEAAAGQPPAAAQRRNNLTDNNFYVCLEVFHTAKQFLDREKRLERCQAKILCYSVAHSRLCCITRYLGTRFQRPRLGKRAQWANTIGQSEEEKSS
ncbi:unnamed protein product [Cylicocyclus nassatus]|uniref:Uncharacterized protein n=1 Tax=Cylicocyclus nassatus TaxID=53992 RepID=A0AA36M851_CYLNA|nr:unnamed protein product [Cylicocyclus nassatus]